MNKFDHITPILVKLHWLPVRYRINFKILLITFKVIHGRAPKYLSELLTCKTKCNYKLGSTSEILLQQPRIKTLRTLGDRSFTVAAPALWNNLPNVIRSAVTQHRIFTKFFSISLGFSRFFRSYFVLQILELKEFNKTIIPFSLVGYETGYSQLGATPLVGYLPSHIQRALIKKIVNYISTNIISLCLVAIFGNFQNGLIFRILAVFSSRFLHRTTGMCCRNVFSMFFCIFNF